MVAQDGERERETDKDNEPPPPPTDWDNKRSEDPKKINTK